MPVNLDGTRNSSETERNCLAVQLGIFNESNHICMGQLKSLTMAWDALGRQNFKGYRKQQKCFHPEPVRCRSERREECCFARSG